MTTTPRRSNVHTILLPPQGMKELRLLSAASKAGWVKDIAVASPGGVQGLAVPYANGNRSGFPDSRDQTMHSCTSDQKHLCLEPKMNREYRQRCSQLGCAD